jgi:hypothetical protein
MSIISSEVQVCHQAQRLGRRGSLSRFSSCSVTLVCKQRSDTWAASRDSGMRSTTRSVWNHPSRNTPPLRWPTSRELSGPAGSLRSLSGRTHGQNWRRRCAVDRPKPVLQLLEIVGWLETGPQFRSPAQQAHPRMAPFKSLRIRSTQRPICFSWRARIRLCIAEKVVRSAEVACSE